MAKVKKTETELVSEPLENKEELIKEKLFDATPEVAKEETEKDFLEKIYRIQNEGGFGMHLNELLLTRIKKLEG